MIRDFILLGVEFRRLLTSSCLRGQNCLAYYQR